MITDVVDVDGIPFNKGFMMDFGVDGIIRDSNRKDTPYYIKENRLYFTDRVCKSTDQPLSFVISLNKDKLTFFIDPFECPERGEKAPSDMIWFSMDKVDYFVDDFIEQELEDVKEAMERICKKISVHLKNNLDSVILHEKYRWRNTVSFFDIFSNPEVLDRLGISNLKIKESIIGNWEFRLEIYIEEHSYDKYVPLGVRIQGQHNDRHTDDSIDGFYDLNSNVFSFSPRLYGLDDKIQTIINSVETK